MKRMAMFAAMVAALLLVFVAVSPAAAQDFTCRVVVDAGGFSMRCDAAVATPVPTETPVPTVEPTATLAPTDVPATATPAPTVVPTVVPPTPDMADMMWHPPGTHGDRPFHEHGDAPPAWLTAAGITPMYVHNMGTPGENMAYYKHTAFKGWAGRFSDGQEWYGVFHLDTNPAGQNGRFHSFQLWIKDATGAISSFSGWLDFGVGNNTGPQKVVVCGADSNIRPIIMVNQSGCQPRFENWYSRAGVADWRPDIGFNINPTYYDGNPAEPATWQPINGAPNNLTRRIEFAWYANRSTVRGEFWADQFGRIVAGPTAPSCGAQQVVGDKTYTILCSRQFIAPTLKSIQFPGNAVQRQFPGNGVVLPN